MRDLFTKACEQFFVSDANNRMARPSASDCREYLVFIGCKNVRKENKNEEKLRFYDKITFTHFKDPVLPLCTALSDQ